MSIQLTFCPRKYTGGGWLRPKCYSPGHWVYGRRQAKELNRDACKQNRGQFVSDRERFVSTESSSLLEIEFVMSEVAREVVERPMRSEYRGSVSVIGQFVVSGSDDYGANQRNVILHVAE